MTAAAYNARDLDRFIAEYADDVRVFRLPSADPAISGKRALAEHYAANRFNLPDLHAALVDRMIMGNKVLDHERIVGVRPDPFEAIAVYEVVDDLIKTVWFFNAD
ncbi:MAG: nuclear transport factor 2 family protein [Casimicrobiaceae bacterium]